MLNIVNEFDSQLLNLNARQLSDVLKGPTLFHLDGLITAPVFVSVLLHGHEDSGWEAIKRLLRKYQDKQLPRSLSLFVGNISAAREQKRKLDDQPDYNRVWDSEIDPGLSHKSEALMMQQIVMEMEKRNTFASIDIHNNTGKNPHYACINRLTPEFINLANIFSRIIVYFIQPEGVQSMAFARFCPSVTVECGQPGDEYGIEQSERLINTALNMKSHDFTEPDPDTYDLYHTIAQIRIAEDCSFSFDHHPADIEFIQGLENLNFEEIHAQSRIAGLNSEHPLPLQVTSENGIELFHEVFDTRDGELQTKKSIFPSMLTTNREIVRQDCLCYLMERYDRSLGEKTKV